MLRQIETPHAPKAIGPYSQAVRAGQFLFVSGTISIDPATGQLIGNTIEDQTRQVLKNLEAILAADGFTFEHVVKCEVFLKDMNDFKSMNSLYAEKFTFAVKPARQTIQAAKLPLDALIEISCIAFKQ